MRKATWKGEIHMNRKAQKLEAPLGGPPVAGLCGPLVHQVSAKLSPATGGQLSTLQLVSELRGLGIQARFILGFWDIASVTPKCTVQHEPNHDFFSVHETATSMPKHVTPPTLCCFGIQCSACLLIG